MANTAWAVMEIKAQSLVITDDKQKVIIGRRYESSMPGM